jgi:DNA-binding ferritin-like protein (Dps family)
MWIEKIVGDLGDKKKYREYKARVKALPGAYREAGAGLERYLMYLGPSDDGAALVAMLNDLADLLEQAAAAGTPIRDLVGADPVDFADAFMDNYGGGSWIRKERTRLSTTIDRAEGEQSGGAS